MNTPNEVKVIQITTSLRCNLNCPYCFQKAPESVYLNRDGHCSYKQTEMLAQTLKEGQEIRLVILGGEPFLELDLIQEIVNTCKAKNVNPALLFLSNGVLLKNDKIFNFLKNLEKEVKSLAIIVSFDNDYKSPKKFTEEDFNAFKQFRGSTTYVIDGKKAIKDIVEDVTILNNHGYSPKILYDYENLTELADSQTADYLVQELNKVSISNEVYSSTPEQCKYMYINEEGEIGPCYSTFYKEIDTSKLEECSAKCEACDIKEKCPHCPPRVALYGDGWCAFARCLARVYKAR